MFSWVGEYPVSAALFLAVFFCLFQSWWFKKDFFSPLNVYCFSQCITLGIAYFQIDKAMTDFKPFTWMVWSLGMGAFACGCIVTRLYAKSKKYPVEVATATVPKRYNWTIHLVLSLAVFMFFMVGVYGLVQKAGNLIVFTDDPSKWMSKDVDYGLYALLLSSGPLCVLLFGVGAFKKFNNITWVRRVCLTMVLATIVINLMAYPNRTSLFFNVGFFLIFVNYLYKRISPLVIASLIVLAVIAFISISSLRNQYGGGSVEGKALDVVIDLPYKYVANNYWNLDYALNPPNDREIHPHTYGIDFFSGIFEYARLSGSFKTSYHWDDAFNERIQKVYGFNTVNYLWDVYKDFHIFGVFLFPLLCGIGLTVLHLRLCKPFTPRQVLMYTYFIYFVGWWFFTSGYKQGIYCIWGMAIFFISTVCMWQKKLPADSSVVDKVDGELQGKQEIACEGEHRDVTGGENGSAADACSNV